VVAVKENKSCPSEMVVPVSDWYTSCSVLTWITWKCWCQGLLLLVMPLQEVGDCVQGDVQGSGDK
jgi:hypothetical protein